MTMLRLENGCTALKAQSPLTSGAIHIKGFPYPVGKFTNTSLPLKIFLLRIEVLNPKGRATPETALTLVALAHDFLQTRVWQ